MVAQTKQYNMCTLQGINRFEEAREVAKNTKVWAKWGFMHSQQMNGKHAAKNESGKRN